MGRGMARKYAEAARLAQQLNWRDRPFSWMSFQGIGKTLVRYLNEAGYRTLGDLADASDLELTERVPALGHERVDKIKRVLKMLQAHARQMERVGAGDD